MTDESSKVSGRIFFTVETTGETYRFDNFRELEAWSTEQRTKWECLSDAKIRNVYSNLSANAADITRRTFENLDRETTHIAQTEPSKDSDLQWSDKEIQEKLSILQEHLTPIIKGHIQVPDSVRGREILSLYETDPQKASALLILSTEHQDVLNQGIPNWRFLKSALDILPYPDSKTHINETENHLRKMRQRWDGKLTAIIRDLEKRRNLEDEARNKFKTDIEKGRQIFRQLFTTSNQERNHHQDEMKRIEDTFHAHLSLQAPATYWTSKQTQHVVVSVVAGIIFFGLSGLAIWLAWSHGPTFVDEVTKGKEGFNMGAFAMITIPALVGAWAMRFVARVFVSNLHLSQDAGLRSTMITTYLALMKDPDSEVSREERALILNAMFRPADHHGDDDGPSPKLIELMQKMSAR